MEQARRHPIRLKPLLQKPTADGPFGALRPNPRQSPA